MLVRIEVVPGVSDHHPPTIEAWCDVTLHFDTSPHTQPVGRITPEAATALAGELLLAAQTAERAASLTRFAFADLELDNRQTNDLRRALYRVLDPATYPTPAADPPPTDPDG